jgi:hypothetical protein
MTTTNTDKITTNRYSRHAFGGGEHGELLAHEALTAHEATLIVGARVRAYRVSECSGVIVDDAPQGRSVTVEDSDGLRYVVETRNLELATDSEDV